MRSISADSWIRAAATGAVAYGAALAASVMLVILIVIAGGASAAEDIDGGVATGQGFGAAVSVVVQLVLMAFFAPLEGAIGGEAALFFGAGLGFTATLVPLLITIAGLVAAYLFIRFNRRRSRGLPATTLARIVQAGTGGLVFAVLSLAFGLIFALRIREEGFELTVHAVSVLPFACGWLLISSAAFLGSRTEGSVISTGWRAAARLLGAHVLVWSGVLTLATLIAVVSMVEFRAIFAAVAMLPNLLVYEFALVHLGGLGVEASLGTAEALTIFSDGIPLGVRIAAPVLAVLLVLAAGLRWSITRGSHASSAIDWVRLPVVYGAFGIVISLATMVSVEGEAFGGGMTASAALYPWVFLLFAVVGLLIEIVARYLAPMVLPSVPVPVRRILLARAATSPSVTLAGSVAGVPPTQPGQAELSDPTPMSPRAKKMLLIGSFGVAGVAVLGIGGTYAHQTLQAGEFGPQKTVEDYLQKLVDGQAADALALYDRYDETADRTLLTAAAYEAAQNKISGYRIISTDIADGQATVEAEVTQGGQTSSTSFTLRTEGRQAGIFDGWQLLFVPEQRIVIEAETPTVMINGAEVQMPGSDGLALHELVVLPGTYTVSVPNDDPFYDHGEPREVTARFGESASVPAFETTRSPEFEDAAIAAAADYVAACMAQTTMEVEPCGLNEYSWGDDEDVRNVKWELVTEPEYSIGEDFWTDGEAVNLSGGEALVTYQENDAWGDEPDEWEDVERSHSLYLNLMVTVQDGEVTVDQS
ncbi:hypothetical protein [Arthrobacter flavus]|uniref:Uncharacterized protein n=1 Tax=Arthrobacter flavus TaxID=95172 RepID=A0ABW4QC92_9MICC